MSAHRPVSHHNRLIHNLLYIMAKKNLMLTRKIDHMGQRSIREKVMAISLLSNRRDRKMQTFTIPYNRQQLADYPCGGPKCLVCGTFQDEKGRADPV